EVAARVVLAGLEAVPVRVQGRLVAAGPGADDNAVPAPALDVGLAERAAGVADTLVGDADTERRLAVPHPAGRGRVAAESHRRPPAVRLLPADHRLDRRHEPAAVPRRVPVAGPLVGLAVLGLRPLQRGLDAGAA